MPVLALHDIRKNYGRVQALRGVSLEVPEGSVFGVLGPNGSGKTTLLGIVLDVLQATAGSYAWFDGKENAAARREIGALLETPNFYPYLDADDNLAITARIKRRGANDRDRVLQAVGLLERRKSPFSTYSLGMKQRLAIAAALLGSPRVLVLDEPTNGLDAAGITDIRELIKGLRSEGATVILASHLLDEVEKVCTHVAILKFGEVLVTGAVGEVLRSEDTLVVKAYDMAKLERAVRTFPGLGAPKLVNGHLHCGGENIDTASLNQHCYEQGIILSHLAVHQRSLESKFMEITTTSRPLAPPPLHVPPPRT
ncbi:MAG TPA: ABC transporter ATP-binding protein [Chthoniobacteraceae bacterium]|nr:ABC transporter ATP-binding protein [Chthoniobacteraceae bacterium]